MILFIDDDEEVHTMFSEYNENIRELIDQVLTYRVFQPEDTKKISEKIITYANRDNDSKLLGFAYYHLAESYFIQNEYDKFIKNLIRGLEHQHKASLGSLLARSYNMLGINSFNQGDVAASIDFYLTSLKYSQDHELYYEAGLVNTNIGQIYIVLQEYRTAIQYLEKAITYFNMDKDERYRQYIRNQLITETALATCYLRLEDKEPALDLFHKIEKERDKYLGEARNHLALYCYEVFFYSTLGEVEKMDELIDQLILLVDEIPSLLDKYDEAFMLCDVLLAEKRYQDLWRVLMRMDYLTKQAGITNMLLRILKYKMQYYKELQDEQAYLLACADYCKLAEQQESENRTNTIRAIELRVDLEQIKEKHSLIQEENKLLIEKSERDPLTMLPNREKLNAYSEDALTRAFQNGTSLGVEIFDIDFFKEYNDTYGHQAGDNCLSQVAQLLHALMEKGIFCARYGGDEFILIYEDMTDEEIMEIARKLQQDVIDMNLKINTPAGQQVLTISQGIRNSVPTEGNKLWDYFYVADMSMYQVKRRMKNDILLLHKAVTQQDNGATTGILS